MRAWIVCGVLLGCGGGDGGGGSGGTAGAGGSGGMTNAPVAHFEAPATTPVDALSVPFPSDLYLDSGGVIQIGKFPGTTNAQFDAALHAAWAQMDGWGVSQGVFFLIDGDVDPATIDGSIHVFDLASGSEVPVHIGWNAARHTVGAVPADFVLLDAHRYAAVLTDVIRSHAGAAVVASTDFAALRGSAPADARLAHAFNVVQPALAAAAAKGITADHIVAAASYRTQSVIAPMEKLRQDLDAAAPQPITSVIRVITQAELDSFFGTPTTAEEGLDAPGASTPKSVQHSHLGWVIHANIRIKSYTAPTDGHQGIFQLDSSGHPQVAGQFEVPITIALPRTNCCTNLPLVVFQHGITDLRSHLFAVADGFAAQGIATAGIDLPFHGSRAPNARDLKNDITGAMCAQSPCDYFGDYFGLNSPIYFFNLGGDTVTNVLPDDPRAGRDNFRESTAENMQVVRALIAAGNLTAITSATGAPTAISFRSDRIAFMGHSLGTFVGPALAAVDQKFGAFVFTSAGAGIVVPAGVDGPQFGSTFEPFLENGFNIAGEFNVTPGGDGQFHPSLGFYEAVFEAGDGLGPIPSVIRDASHRGGVAPHVLVAHAAGDEAVPDQSAEPFGQAMGLTRVTMSIQTPDLRYAMMPQVAAPYAPSSGPTAAFVLYSPASHDLVQYTHVQMNFEPGFPPWTPLPTPMLLSNPVPQEHRQIERFLIDYFAGQQPTVIDPFQ